MADLERQVEFASEEEKQTIFTKLLTELPMDQVQERLEERTGIVKVGDYLGEAKQRIKTWGMFMGLSSGYPNFDNTFRGFVGGELTLLGGYTSHGKTQFAANLAFNIASAGHKVLFVTLEMTHEEISTRFYKMAKQSGKGDDWFKTLPIVMQVQMAVDYQEIGMVSRRAKEEGAEIVIIDYIQYMTGDSRDERLELTRIVKALKRQALSTNLPYVVLSQFSRPLKDGTEVEPRPNILSFKGSSALEQAADICMYAWRKNRTDSLIDVGVLKNRNRGYDETPWTFQSQEGARMTELGVQTVVED